jgi:hypothetical protein
MSIKAHLETAEDAVRQALINALAEGEDQYLTELFNLLTQVRATEKKINRTKYNFNLSSEYFDLPNSNINIGNSPDVIQFPTSENVE